MLRPRNGSVACIVRIAIVGACMISVTSMSSASELLVLCKAVADNGRILIDTSSCLPAGQEFSDVEGADTSFFGKVDPGRVDPCSSGMCPPNVSALQLKDPKNFPVMNYKELMKLSPNMWDPSSQ